MTVSLSDFRAYHLERGNSAPTSADDTDAEAALVRGEDYVRDTYINKFMPRYADPLPDDVDAAIYEAAALELATPSFFTATYTEAGEKALVGVGSIRWEFVGRKGGSRAPISTKIEAMLRPYMGGATTFLARA